MNAETTHNDAAFAGNQAQVKAASPLAPIVETTAGLIRGSDDGSTRSFKGIRYAAAPVGELRWRAPQPPTAWTDVADATEFGPVAPQPANPVIALGDGAVQSEDCLTLNVFESSTVAAGDAKPVMVWIHGGAYMYGSSRQPLFDGASLVEGGDVVLVTINYRLGALGFLDLEAFSSPDRRFDSNLALRDVLLALNWVKDNIAAFGGDPEQVTIFGESAGGGMVTTLLTVPAASGLFSRAIAQSSPSTSVYSVERADRVVGMFLKEAGVDPANFAALAELPVETIVEAGKAVFREVPTQFPGTLAFAPVVDGELVPDYPIRRFRAGLSHPIPLIIGTNRDEAAMFKLMKSPLIPIKPDPIMAMFTEMAAERPEVTMPSTSQVETAYARLNIKKKGLAVARDIGFRMPTVWLAEGHSAVAPVYLYRFDWATPVLTLLGIGATHATELPYLWGNLVSGPKDITFKLGGLKRGRQISRRMQARWLSFAVTGDPNTAASAPAWHHYSPAQRSTLVIDAHDSAVDDLDKQLREAWGDEVLSFL